MTIGWITGLTAEARLLKGHVQIGGGTPQGAAQAAERLIAQGVTALISFGLAGGLDPALQAGTIVIPEAILDGETYRTDPALNVKLGGPTHALMAAGPHIVVTAQAKAALFAQTHAAAIDLESGAVARVATAHTLPFAVIRAICDPATSSLPPAALAALDSAGAIGFSRVLLSVLTHPTQIPSLITLARDATRAGRALREAIKSIASYREAC
jgi:adenosylhomocysteine nucleosidase